MVKSIQERSDNIMEPEDEEILDDGEVDRLNQDIVDQYQMDAESELHMRHGFLSRRK